LTPFKQGNNHFESLSQQYDEGSLWNEDFRKFSFIDPNGTKPYQITLRMEVFALKKGENAKEHLRRKVQT
jgi:hypothetical protein